MGDLGDQIPARLLAAADLVHLVGDRVGQRDEALLQLGHFATAPSRQPSADRSPRQPTVPEGAHRAVQRRQRTGQQTEHQRRGEQRQQQGAEPEHQRPVLHHAGSVVGLQGGLLAAADDDVQEALPPTFDVEDRRRREHLATPRNPGVGAIHGQAGARHQRVHRRQIDPHAGELAGLRRVRPDPAVEVGGVDLESRTEQHQRVKGVLERVAGDLAVAQLRIVGHHVGRQITVQRLLDAVRMTRLGALREVQQQGGRRHRQQHQHHRQTAEQRADHRQSLRRPWAVMAWPRACSRRPTPCGSAAAGSDPARSSPAAD